MTANSRSRWWFDPRFAIGLALVVASVLGVLGLVSAADSSVHVYASRSTLSPGDRIHRGDLVDSSVRIGGLRSKYLSVRDIPAEGLVVTRVVLAGELVPASAIGSVSSARVTSVVVSVKSQLARSIEAGAVVDIWSAASLPGGSFGPPTVLVSSATVVRVVRTDGVMGASGGASIELLVPRSRTARVLEAVANDDSVSLVPANIPAGH
jgi:hypothetical protein